MGVGGCEYCMCVLQGMYLNVGAFCGTCTLYMHICIKRV